MNTERSERFEKEALQLLKSIDMHLDSVSGFLRLAVTGAVSLQSRFVETAQAGTAASAPDQTRR
jgi:hypothetical protein